MITLHSLGFPRIGKRRELKFAVEQYWRGDMPEEHLESIGRQLRREQWESQSELDMVTVGDFSFYDHVLDTSFLFGHYPELQSQQRLKGLEHYFALARGLDNENTGNQPITPLPMTKWFNTNYHYSVSTISEDTEFKLNAKSLLAQCEEAEMAGYRPKPTILGPLTYLWLCDASSDSLKLEALQKLVPKYSELLTAFSSNAIEWVQIEEPILTLDLPPEWKQAFQQTYSTIRAKSSPKLMLTTYFGDIGEHADWVLKLPVDGIHLDAKANESYLITISEQLEPHQVLSLGVVDGRNIWKTNYEQTLDTVTPLYKRLGERLWLAPSTSLLHLPVDLSLELHLPRQIKEWVCFAKQRIQELTDIKQLLQDDTPSTSKQLLLKTNKQAVESRSKSLLVHKPFVKVMMMNINENMYHRSDEFETRSKLQQQTLALPPLPTTTIGSFPQTNALRKLRQDFKEHRISHEYHQQAIQTTIEENIELQERIGLDVLVHGEPERSDMVEFFAEKLDGFATTEHAWVQSYGTRCVRPPILYGDTSRPSPMTVELATYAQSLSEKPVKGMLTGPVTMLTWSFVRDDQPRSVTCQQLALAIRDEVIDLESAGISVIQIDEPALKEGFPLKLAAQPNYIQWAIDNFKLATSGVKSTTQIHSHMCYSHFSELIPHLQKLDIDVLTIENARAGSRFLNEITESNYTKALGPGIFDIHTPTTPSEISISNNVKALLTSMPPTQIWVNPDCGLKTRTWQQTEESLKNMVNATQSVRNELETRKQGV